MIKALKRSSDTISISTLWENFGLSKYNFNPPYQRQSVWTDEKQSFLIDSILRNFPIPAVFFKENIDQDSGKTTYDIIDGKQRILAIVRFLNNEIPVTSDSEDNEIINVAGMYFSDFDSDKGLEEIKRSFWSYRLRVEYIDTADIKLIDSVFDRLNRNGEPLSGQELRNAMYHSSHLLAHVQRIANEAFWSKLLVKLDRSRMEDLEFISELLFMVAEGGPQESNSESIDALYRQYANDQATVDTVVNEFNQVASVMHCFGLDFETFRISGVSHVYGIFSFALYCYRNRIDPNMLSDKLNILFEKLRSKKLADPIAIEYKETMSSRTRSRNQRVRRLEALKRQCGIR